MVITTTAMLAKQSIAVATGQGARRWLCRSVPVAVDGKVARSLKDVARGGAVQALLLPKSQDLMCRNLMCEHVGSSCTCRLALVLDRVPALQRMDLSNNNLRALPDNTFELTALTHLDVSGNVLTTLSPAIAQLQTLQDLDLRHNRLEALPEQALLALPHLQRLRIDGNPLSVDAIESPALRRIIDSAE
ncbi:TPA: hypothetical protein N0F65_005972 [Lagenidium giganteum]|uniref:Leucine-rich repeat domain-containing protein n=1 Tax=Lagenidium giganteum TaxID=4803 RepID=A0AAV2ZEH2_9STRA|nr:TPA: hypothetical protein N0F65_005972 [Lagenidium giganteum]